MNEHDEYLRRRDDRDPEEGGDMVLAALFLAALFGALWLCALAYVAWRAASVQ